MGTQEWVRKGGELNICYGCMNDCYYCYARNLSNRMHKEKLTGERVWGRLRFDEWSEYLPMINWEIVNKKFKKAKSSHGKYDYMFPTTHDIFPNTSKTIELCKNFKITINLPYYDIYKNTLLKLLKAGNSVLITTKPRLSIIKKLCEDVKEYKDSVGFRFTIGSTNSKTLRMLERKATSFTERLKSLEYAYIKEFPTTISAEPLLDKNPFELYDKLKPFLSPLNLDKDQGTFWIGLLKVRYIPHWFIELHKLSKTLKTIQENQKFNNTYSWYKDLVKDKRIRMKESVKKMMINNNIRVFA